MTNKFSGMKIIYIRIYKQLKPSAEVTIILINLPRILANKTLESQTKELTLFKGMSPYNELTLLFVADRGNDQELEVKLDINQTCQIVYLSADIKHTKNQGFEDVTAILDSHK